MATPRWRGGPHGSIPCKQIGVVELAQAIHAVSGPGHLEAPSSPTKNVSDVDILAVAYALYYLVLAKG
ncbi:hypothetical protein V6N12_053354 [Hibiscus sabdariffa]|uniref:Uncharacterized protein n=1 Tax=Hibiscus sabdariffa TaxID=183260 RepID=A0ABR2D904_9ROSI